VFAYLSLWFVVFLVLVSVCCVVGFYIFCFFDIFVVMEVVYFFIWFIVVCCFFGFY